MEILLKLINHSPPVILDINRDQETIFTPHNTAVVRHTFSLFFFLSKLDALCYANRRCTFTQFCACIVRLYVHLLTVDSVKGCFNDFLLHSSLHLHSFVSV